MIYILPSNSTDIVHNWVHDLTFSDSFGDITVRLITFRYQRARADI